MVRARSCFFYCLLGFLILPMVQAQSRVRRIGYITRVESPTSFQLNQQRVAITPSTKLLKYNPGGTVDKDPFAIDMAVPGKQVIVQGVEDRQTFAITAKEIQILESGSRLKVEGTAYEDRAPELVQSGSGWQGKVYADGYEINVVATTQVNLPTNVTGLDSFRPDVRVEYYAVRQPDGSLLAGYIEFSLDDDVSDEREYRKTSQFKIELPDYDKKIPGEVHLFLHGYKILPDRPLQNAVQSFGLTLVPEWQQQLQDSDPAKIHFHFYVLQKAKGLNRTFSNDSGTVFIPAQLLPKLQNEAQLACVLSADVAGIIASDGYHSRSHKRAQYATEIAGLPTIGLLGDLGVYEAFSAAYWSPLLEHEYRLGLRYVVAGGYDPRQAPMALERIGQTHPDVKNDNKLHSFANAIDIALGFDYGQVDYTSLRTGKAEYAKLLDLLAAADPKMKVPGKTRLADE